MRPSSNQGSPNDVQRLDTIGATVREIYRQAGWPSVTIAQVARRAGLSRVAVRSGFGDRDGLAAAVWEQFIPTFDRLSVEDRAGVAVAVDRFLLALVDRAQEHPEVTESMLRSYRSSDVRLAARPASERIDQRVVHPRARVPVARLLSELLLRRPSSFRSSSRQTQEPFIIEAATTMADLAMSRGSLLPGRDPEAIVESIMVLCLDGLLARRRRAQSPARPR